MKLGHGYIPDTPDVVTHQTVNQHAEKLLGVSAPAPSEWSTIGRMHDRLFQSWTNSCVGHAMAACLYIGAASSGHPIPMPSPRWIYDGARLYRSRRGPIPDVGCMPTDAALAMTEFGLCSMASYSLHPETIESPPPLRVRQLAGDAILSGFFRVPFAFDTVEQIDRAGALGFPTFVGMPVDSAFMDWSGDGVWPGCMGEPVGNHAMAIVAKRDGKYLVLNSYGRDWGADGCIWMPEDWIASNEVFDRLLFKAIPKVIS